jgi:hypothetical protein
LQNISVNVQNFGADTLFYVPVSYSINSSTPFTDTLYTTLLPSQSAIHTFSQAMTVLSGNQTVCVYTDLSSDNNYLNDTVCFVFKGLDEYSPTFFDDFESTDKWYSSSSNNQWERGTPNSSNIQSAYSGMNAWATSLNTNYSPNSVDYLYSPYFKISISDTVYIDFMHNMNVNVGNAFGILEYSFDGLIWIPYGYSNMPNSVNWYNNYSAGAYSWSDTTNGYINSKAHLDPATFNNNSTFQFRFKFQSESSSLTGDGWVIDDFKLGIHNPAKDAKLISIINPDSSTFTGDSISVNILFTNLGTDSIYNLDLNYKINNSTAVTETYNNTIAPMDSVSYAFNQKYAALNSDYQICSFTSLNNDADNSNDTICKMINSLVPDYDIEVNSIINPINLITLAGDSVTVRIINRGKNSVTNIPVEFYRGYGTSFHEYDTILSTIASGDSLDFTFSKWLNPPLGQFNLCVEAKLANDNNFSNNSKCVMLYPGSINDLEKYGFEIKQNIPNPFENITKFELISKKATKSIFTVSNLYGQILYSEELQIFSGTNKFEKDFSNLAPGIYLYNFEIDKVVISKKMLIIK